MGMYISSDPIGLNGNNPTLYGYVEDVNVWIDVLGLDVILGQVGTYQELSNASKPFDGLEIHHVPQDRLGYLPRPDDIAVTMKDEDHALTRTYKSKGVLTYQKDQYRNFIDIFKDDLIGLHNISDMHDKSIIQTIKKCEDL